ncbi:DNA replication licensing factor MCM4 [Sarcoptes scabiei]|nr:DNA replication licensing factor MCM4 [Sarcoptes scabiei]
MFPKWIPFSNDFIIENSLCLTLILMILCQSISLDRIDAEKNSENNNNNNNADTIVAGENVRQQKSTIIGDVPSENRFLSDQNQSFERGNDSRLLLFQSSSQSQSSSCICDKNDSKVSSSPSSFSSSVSNRKLSFIPNQPVYDQDRILIFLITPTYTRPTQMADMTRLAQTLRLVPDIFWIVVEDSHNKSKCVEDLLNRTNVPYVQLLGPRPLTHLDKRSGRGVSNRLKAFEWLRENYLNSDQKGVIYFADDDNAYDVRIFDEMRDTRRVSMFPVGLISTLGLSTPIVSQKTGKIIGFHDPFIGRRKFAVDMAGFALNLQFFLSQKKATMPFKVGYEEDYFLKSLGIKIWQLEPKAKNCTQVLVWHTKTKPADQPKLTLMRKVTNYNETNLPKLYDNLLDS